MSTHEHSARESQLRAELDAAAMQYHQSKQNYQEILKLQIQPESVQSALMAEIQARENYLEKLKAFASFILPPGIGQTLV